MLSARRTKQGHRARGRQGNPLLWVAAPALTASVRAVRIISCAGTEKRAFTPNKETDQGLCVSVIDDFQRQ